MSEPAPGNTRHQRILQLLEDGLSLTPGEVAVLFRVDPKTVTRWAGAGRLKSWKTPGGQVRFFADDVKRALAEQTQEAQ